MVLLKPEFMRAHPVQSGLLWTGIFVPLFLLAMLLMGNQVTMSGVLFLVGMAVIGGFAWGFTMQAFHNWRASK
jgi:hypothetical protein